MPSRRASKLAALVGGTLVTVVVSVLLGFNRLQIAALSSIVFMTLGIILYWEYKVPAAAFGLFLLFLTGALDIHTFIEHAHLDVIMFLVGMMIIVEYLERTAFFEHIIGYLRRHLCRTALSLITVFYFMTALFSSLVGVLTAVLFMIPMILELALRYRVNPIPLVLLMVFAANIGSSATVVGNPVGILIALGGDLTFFDFIRWATPITATSLLVSLGLGLAIFRRDLRALDLAMSQYPPDAFFHKKISRSELVKAWGVFLGVITAIAMHEVIEEALGLAKGSMLLASSIGGSAVVMLLVGRERIHEIIEEGVDWTVLLFFIFLFSSIGTLEKVGITKMIANYVKTLSYGSELTLLLTVSITAAGLSAVLDNVLTVAFFIPIIKYLEQMGVHVYPLWWGLLFASTYFGNFTVIASTANIVAVSLLEARKVGTVSFVDWLKYGPIFSVVPLAIALLLLWLQIPLM